MSKRPWHPPSNALRTAEWRIGSFAAKLANTEDGNQRKASRYVRELRAAVETLIVQAQLDRQNNIEEDRAAEAVVGGEKTP